MGRAVGGASAAGCGAFGLVGLLVSVGLVVWLGSIAFDGSSGVFGGRGHRSATQVTTVPPGLSASGATATIRAPDDLGDGGTVAITATGLGDRSTTATTTVCLAHPLDGTGDGSGDDHGAPGCDASTRRVAPITGDGALTIERTVPRVIEVGGTAYDCAAATGACVLRIQVPDQPDDPGISAALTFAAGLPPVEAEVPPTG